MKSPSPIIIYQMGKVGSSSIHASLKNLNIANPIHHAHFLSWDAIQDVEKYYHGLPHVAVSDPLLHSKRLRFKIDASKGSIRWKIITLVRDPVARDISDLFENMERDLPHLLSINEDSALSEIKAKLRKMFHSFDEASDYACSWFDNEIMAVFDLDIYATDFNKSIGYQIYETRNADILALKLEKLHECCRDAFRAFLDIEDFSLLKANVGVNKKYSDLYKQVLESISIPETDLDKIYNSRYSQHFYTSKEIYQFKKKWSRSDSGNKPIEHKCNFRQDNRKKILIIHPEGNINNNPNLTGIIQILCANNYVVHICSLREEGICQKSPCDGATLLLVDSKNMQSTDGFVLFDEQALNSAENTIRRINKEIDKYDLIIGVDRGIIEASLIASVQKVPYGLISYEIFFEEEAGRAFKNPERKACENIAFAVCQDRLRARFLSSENNIPLEKILTVPVSGRFSKKGGKDYYLYNSLGIDKTRKIALLIGSLGEWTMTKYLIESAQSWRKDWALVIHSRYGLDQAALPYYEKYKELDNVYFSLKPTAQPDQLDKILHSADLGVALYKSLANDIWAGNNIKYIGMASGKIATYLQHGLPVMINEIGEMSNHVRNADLGIVVDDSQKIDISFTDKDLARWRKNCFSFFEDKLDLNYTSIPLVKTIERLIQPNILSPAVPYKVASDFQKAPLPTAGDQLGPEEIKTASKEYLVTAVVSTYNAERFIRGCLEDLENQTIADKLEIVVVNSGSQQNEEEIIREFQNKYSNIKYIKTNQRETVYAAWNRGIKAASGNYITNTNTDDRHRLDALEVMARGLEENPEIGVVYADTLITDKENETFENNTAKQYFNRPNFNLRQLLLFSFFGPQPMWRRSVHQKIGYFDASLSVSGDYDFFIKLSREFGALHIAEILGLYTCRNGSIENSDREKCVSETRQVLRRYRSKIPLEEIYPDLKSENEPEKALAACLVDQGNCCLFGDLPDIESALDCYNRSLEYGYSDPELIANIGVALWLSGNQTQGMEVLRRNADRMRSAAHNLAVIEQCLEKGKHPQIGQLQAADFYHPVVSAAASGKGLTIEENRLVSIETVEKCLVGSDMVCSLPGKTDGILTDGSQPALDASSCVSVIVPTFNRPEMLKEALKSILNQTYQNFEIVVVNDCGDDVSDLIDQFRDPRIKYIQHEKNIGLAAARNTGIKNASGQFIALLDDDDVFFPEHLEIAIKNLSEKHPVIYTDAVRASYERSGGTYKLLKKNVPYSIDFDRNKLLIGNISPVNCFVFDKNLAFKAGIFDETLSTLEDWEFWIRLSALVPFKHVARPTVQVNWRTDGSTMTSSLASEFKKNREKIYSKYQNEINQIPNKKQILKEFQKIWAQDWLLDSPLTSIIILTHNQLEMTKKCVNSIIKHATGSYEIIFVDNGSSDKTCDYLADLVQRQQNFHLIANNENKGFAAGNNQGIAAARGDYILLMNNDIVVTPVWLERMVSCAERESRIGIVGPMSNSVSGPQLVKDITYNITDLGGLDDFAEEFSKINEGRAKRFMRVVGFCMLIKRAVIDKIGGLDERYGLGNFEDDDFSLRAALAGYESWMAQDCFIHHFGNQTFIGAKIDYNESLRKNWEIFKRKWGLPTDLLLGSNYNWAQILKGRFIREKHCYPLNQGNYFETGEKDNSPLLSDAGSLKELYQKVQRLVNDGRQEEAVGGLERLLGMDPDFAMAHNDLGILYYNQGDKEKTLNHYEQAVQIEPHNLIFQKNLADFYFVESGRVEDALTIYNKVLEVDFGDVEALMAMGLICASLGRPEDARHFYNRVLEHEPWNVDARQQLENLYPN